MKLATDIAAYANPNTDRRNIVLRIASDAVLREYTLSPTLAEVLVLALTDALEIVDERT